MRRKSHDRKQQTLSHFIAVVLYICEGSHFEAEGRGTRFPGCRPKSGEDEAEDKEGSYLPFPWTRICSAKHIDPVAVTEAPQHIVNIMDHLSGISSHECCSKCLFTLTVHRFIPTERKTDLRDACDGVPAKTHTHRDTLVNAVCTHTHTLTYIYIYMSINLYLYWYVYIVSFFTAPLTSGNFLWQPAHCWCNDIKVTGCSFRELSFHYTQQVHFLVATLPLKIPKKQRRRPENHMMVTKWSHFWNQPTSGCWIGWCASSPE